MADPAACIESRSLESPLNPWCDGAEGGRIMTLTAHRPTTTATLEVDGFDSAYERLVDARLEYEMLKRSGAPIGAIVQARGSLHQARARMADHRRSTL
jgi:hypothetical protein